MNYPYMLCHVGHQFPAVGTWLLVVLVQMARESILIRIDLGTNVTNDLGCLFVGCLDVPPEMG